MFVSMTLRGKGNHKSCPYKIMQNTVQDASFRDLENTVPDGVLLTLQRLHGVLKADFTLFKLSQHSRFIHVHLLGFGVVG